MYPVSKYREPPRDCKITQARIFFYQVNILKRHGARFPTSSAANRILSGVNKLKSATSFTNPHLQFLANFTYDLGTDVLVPLGALQSYNAGKSVFSRYRRLVGPDNVPFVRASGSERVVDSATNWTSGFSFASQHKLNPVLSVIMSEDPTANNTLDDSGCPLAGDSDDKVNVWVDIYASPIADRLNSQAVGMNANITATDIDNLISLCPFESVAKQKLSRFCDVFERQDFTGFEWSMDLGKYYGTGYGQPIGGRVQGVGYVNELIARLTNSPVRDNTQTNRTLTSDPATFPLNRTIYADFSHDNQMVAIYSAIGLLNKKHEVLDNTKINPKTEWDTSDIVPFSAEMVVERLSCHSYGRAKEYVRILINDAIQPLSFCGGDNNGLCELSRFVESQSYAQNDGEGDFQKCFAA
ncbi:3-phytase A [Leucoagaricus sp. SymC.cos]|nr:3-phytase A [Leucoagaricus sp. SymC.cos]